MASFRDDYEAALRRIEALEQELEALRRAAASGEAPRRASPLLAVAVARGLLATFAVFGGIVIVGYGIEHRDLIFVVAGALFVATSIAVAVVGRGRPAPSDVGRPAGVGDSVLPGTDPVSGEELKLNAHYVLPVSFVVDRAYESLHFSVRTSTLTGYAADYRAYRFVAALRNEGEAEVRALCCRLELIDSAGGGHDGGWDSITPLDYEAPVRPGDVFVFDHLLALEKEVVGGLLERDLGVDEARLTVVSAELGPVQSYPPSEQRFVPSDVDVPDRFQLSFRTRQEDPGHLDLEVENVGNEQIERLSLRVRYHREDGSTTDDAVVCQVTYQGRPIPPGETRVERLSLGPPKGTVRAEPVIVEIG